jgi:cytochrome P450
VSTATIDIYSPDVYIEAPPHALFEELRRTTPVFFQEMEREPGYWAVLKHADVVHVAKHPVLFSATEGGVVLENLTPERLAMMQNMLLAMDPPRHLDYRRPLAPSFKLRVIAQMEEQIRNICRGIMARAAEQRDVEFVHDVTSSLPSQVIGELMGLPREDWDLLHHMAEMNNTGQDPEMNPDSYASGANHGTFAMAKYAMEFAAKRRGENPGEDLTTLILGSEFGGKFMTDVDFGGFFVQLVTAGNDTTKTMLSSGVVALLTHPEQLAAVREDPAKIPGAVEEILRWYNPLHYFRRTATEDTVLNGAQIKAGDKVAMYYTSANRDEDVFDDPQSFDIRRHPNPHLSFGIGGHFCLGVHLARLEGKVFFEELLGTFPSIELIGDPVRTRSNLNNALKRLPIRLGG